ncbi:MAG TPA: SCO family protein [Thermoanaerobaculia bacterium]|nr:SCO family protein [Thermoanaerobaculia bacterium]
MFRTISTMALSAALLAGSAFAMPSRSGVGDRNPSIMPATTMPGPLREVGYDQRIGQQVPLDLAFRDEAGRNVRLGEYFEPGGHRPVILVLAYYHCPMLCDMVLQGVVTTLKPLTFDAGKEFDVVVASIDPDETPEMAAEQEREILARYGRAGAKEGFHFLTGPQASIDALTRAVGFRYVYEKERDEYAHPAGLVMLTPGGRVSRYLFGIDFPPRDVRLGLIESTQDKLGTVVDSLLLYCYHYNPAIGRYSTVVFNILRLAAGATLIGLVTLVVMLRRRESRQAAQPAGPVGAA